MFRLINADTGDVILRDLEVAETFWTRLRGLQFRRGLPADRGLLLSPCSSLHTCFMRFAIDVVMLSSENEVVGIRRNVRPWRMVLCNAGTAKVVETAAGAVQVGPGTRLDVMEVKSGSDCAD